MYLSFPVKIGISYCFPKFLLFLHTLLSEKTPLYPFNEIQV